MRAFGAIAFSLWATVAQAQQVAEPDGYRVDAYRAPVPETLTGATVVDVNAAHDLWTTGEVAFIDVLPRPPKPENLPEGTVWQEKPHDSIPGSTWLPNVGYGELADVNDAYFRAGLVDITDRRTDQPVLFFCRTDCWMSWNAAKRALEYGYTDVYWMPDGIDGWSSEGHSTEVVEPVPGAK